MRAFCLYRKISTSDSLLKLILLSIYYGSWNSDLRIPSVAAADVITTNDVMNLSILNVKAMM